MPSREEIAGWLQEAALAFRAVNCKPLQDQFAKRAAQVANIRCDTCKRYKEYQRCDYHKAFFKDVYDYYNDSKIETVEEVHDFANEKIEEKDEKEEEDYYYDDGKLFLFSGK